jgi:hypothetical protein
MAYDIPEPDAANLRIPLVGFLPFDDPRVIGTVRTIERELDERGFIRRYRVPDGVPGPEGVFLACSFWFVEVLARMNRRREAAERFRRLVAMSSPLGLFPEEYDPVAQRPLGNYPQAITHVAFLRAALAVTGHPPPTGRYAARLMLRHPIRSEDRERAGVAGEPPGDPPRARSRGSTSARRHALRRSSPRTPRRRSSPEVGRKKTS